MIPEIVMRTWSIIVGTAPVVLTLIREVSVVTFCGKRMQVWKNDFGVKVKLFQFIAVLSVNICLSGYVDCDKIPQHSECGSVGHKTGSLIQNARICFIKEIKVLNSK